jgi:hypothetical protein
MYIQRNIEARSCSHCCSEIAISITYCECIFVALGIQHALRMHRIVICGLSDSTVFFSRFLIHGMIFEKKKLSNKNCVLIFSTTFL